MEKLSMEKRSFYLGKAHALQKMGFTEELIKVAFVQEGFTKEAADELVKEAYPTALIGGAIRGLGSLLARGASGMARSGASKLLAPVKAGLQGRMGRIGAQAMKGIGGAGVKAGRGLVSSGRAFQANPLKAMGGGVMQAGQGMLFGGGKGLGGTIGKGIFGASTASTLMPGGESPQLPQPYGQY